MILISAVNLWINLKDAKDYKDDGASVRGYEGTMWRMDVGCWMPAGRSLGVGWMDVG